MCIVFTSEEVRLLSVAGTKIFVAALADGRQLTVYENTVRQDGVADGSAMVLPVPAGAVTFLDLSNAALFYELRRSFPTAMEIMEPEEEEEDMPFEMFDDGAKLVVRDVGSYRVSLAPCLSDLRRIDPDTFTVPPTIEQLLSTHYGGGRGGAPASYADEIGEFSFVVCRFKDAQVDPHPIGYVHERLEDGRLFVPTRHAHGRDDTGEGAHADWDHDIYTWGVQKLGASSVSCRALHCGDTPDERCSLFNPGLSIEIPPALDRQGVNIERTLQSSCKASLKSDGKRQRTDGEKATANGQGLAHRDPYDLLWKGETIIVEAKGKGKKVRFGTRSGQVKSCAAGGTAEAHRLDGCVIKGFWNRDHNGTEFYEDFDVSDRSHRDTLRNVRPLKVKFERSIAPGGSLRHVRIKGNGTVWLDGQWTRAPSQEVPPFPNEDLLCSPLQGALLPEVPPLADRKAGVMEMAQHWIEGGATASEG